MGIAEALQWFFRGHALAWRSLFAGTLWKSGLRSTAGAFTRPLIAPSRYPEYELVQSLLRRSVDLEDPGTWLLDIGSPKLFSLLPVERSKATLVATDIWKQAIDEASALEIAQIIGLKYHCRRNPGIIGKISGLQGGNWHVHFEPG